MIRKMILGCLMILPMACTTIERSTLPDPISLGPQWERSSAQLGARINHAPWDEFLARYLSTDAKGINRLDYASVTQADRASLNTYLATLQNVQTSTLTRAQQLAFWINLYNAKTVDIVLEAYPVASILDIKDGVLPTGPWNRKVLSVDGESLSLNDVEHRIIRPVFSEARIHYALNCAAAACPNLSPRAWRAEGLDAALSAAEKAYVNDPRGVSFADDGTVRLSKIYAWFREDFGNNEAEIIARLATVANPDLRAKLQGRKGVSQYIYDWSLNDTTN